MRFKGYPRTVRRDQIVGSVAHNPFWDRASGVRYMKLRLRNGEAALVSRTKDKPGTLRPTASRVRLALFSIIASHLVGARVLDLFAGSGALGIEALERGSASVDFVERSRKIAAALTANLFRLGLGDRTRVFTLRAEKAIEKLDDGYDLIFMDPPYNYQELTGLVEKITAGPLIRRTGHLVVEHFKGRVLPEEVGGFSVEKARRYGDTAITIYGPGGF